ncbi:hypothetical protein VNI00_002005 [Paramarasmius palmivorus]|uniref:Uncharacterized protein n=1 Tax=Paramarasmius palmivorus TaxID=297713 RepID=A0AAW0E0D2_9AGAR
MSTGGIFNVQEAQGADQAKFETTAAVAQVEAATSDAARKIEQNAEQAQHAATQAATAAKSLGKEFTGEPPSTADKVAQQAKPTLDAAVQEGKQDVAAAQATGQGYIAQAKTLAANAATTVNNTVQPFIADVAGATDSTTARSAPGQQGPGVVSQLQSGAATAVQTGKEYLDKATTAAQNYLNSLQEQGSTTTGAPAASGIPPTSAPLESGPHTVGTPYPSTTTNTATKVGEVSK